MFRSVYLIVPVCIYLLTAWLSDIPRAHPVVIAHRGDHTFAIENTILAFENAIREGADYVEVDLRQSRDHRLVVFHDENLLRMTGKKGKVANVKLVSLQRLLVRDATRPQLGTSHIPIFGEVLELLSASHTGLYLDFKDAPVAQAWEEIKEAGMEKRLVVYVYDQRTLEHWHALAPEVPVMISLPSKFDGNELPHFLQSHSAEILDGDYSGYTVAMVDEAHESGRKVWVDVQQPMEDADLWSGVLGLGVDGIQTDHPAELIAFLESKGLR